MEVKIIRSLRRRKTISARLCNDLLIVNAPAFIAEKRLQEAVEGFKQRAARRKIKEELDRTADIREIAGRLNKTYFDASLRITSIEYVTNQEAKFGCCQCQNGHIRISHRVGLMPAWVRDYVLIHEMAHLIEPNHSKAFWRIVSRYPFVERARGYLMAIGFEKLPGNVK